MATYTQIIYHIVFATKHREHVLDKERRDDLFRFIWGMLEKRQCHLFRIGGVEDHIHILTALHPTVCLSDLVKEIKTASSAWIKGENVFPMFTHWQEGYGAFTCAVKDKAGLIDYIKRQEEHHRVMTFREEYERLLTEAGMQFYERDKDWSNENDA